MSYTPEDLFEIADKMRFNLTALQGQVTDLKNGLAEIATKLPPSDAKFICPKCGLSKPTAEMMDDHLANVHGKASASVATVAPSAPGPTNAVRHS